MLTAMIIVFFFCLTITLVGVKKNKDGITANLTKGWYAAISYGVINALLNLFVMLSVAYLSPGGSVSGNLRRRVDSHVAFVRADF